CRPRESGDPVITAREVTLPLCRIDPHTSSHARCAPSPLVGEGWGGGWNLLRSMRQTTTPTPNPSPQGGGEQTERVVRPVHQSHPNVRYSAPMGRSVDTGSPSHVGFSRHAHLKCRFRLCRIGCAGTTAAFNRTPSPHNALNPPPPRSRSALGP